MVLGENSASAKTEEPVASSAQDAGANTKREKWQEIKITDTERMLVDKAYSEGLKAFGVTVYVEEACVLKAARAFLVFKALEKLGEIIVSSPTAQDIEDEKFDLTFSLILISANTTEEIIEAVKSVSEIEEAFCAEYTSAKEEKPAAPEKVVESKTVEESKPAATASPAMSKTVPAPAQTPVPTAL